MKKLALFLALALLASLFPAAMAEETGIDHCAVGIRAENGEVTGVCYAIPMVYSPEPPAGLEGYRWIGDQNRGWWTTCDDLTEKSSDP